MDWKNIIATVAPWIGTALGGPLGGLAVDAVGKALGIDQASEATIKQALAGVTPDQMLAIKKADNDFALQMQALGFKQVTDLEALAAGDRRDARAMQVAQRSWVPAALSVLVTLGFFRAAAGHADRPAARERLSGPAAHARFAVHRLGHGHGLLVRHHARQWPKD